MREADSSFFFVLSKTTSGRLFLQFNLQRSTSCLGRNWMKRCWEWGARFPPKHPDSPSAGEWESLCKCGDNGVPTQSIRQRKKIAMRKKNKRKRLDSCSHVKSTFSLQFVWLPFSSAPHVQGEKRRAVSWHSFSRHRVRGNLKEQAAGWRQTSWGRKRVRERGWKGV